MQLTLAKAEQNKRKEVGFMFLIPGLHQFRDQNGNPCV